MAIRRASQHLPEARIALASKPHPEGLSWALDHCRLGLEDVVESDLTSEARMRVDVVERTTQAVVASDGTTPSERLSSLTDDQREDFAAAVRWLADYFEREYEAGA